MPNIKTSTARAAGYAFLLSVFAAGSWTIARAEHTLARNIANAKEAARAADIDITVITADGCDDCSPADPVVAAIQTQPFNILSLKDVAYDSDEGKELMERYAVTRVPAVILTGELEKANVQSVIAEKTTAIADGAVWNDVGPVYIQPATGETMGLVTLTYLEDASCRECYDPVQITDILKNTFGVRVREERRADVNGAEGKHLADTYAITAVPTVILSPETANYLTLGSVWNNVGTVESDGTYVFRNMAQLGQITYRDLTTGRVIGPAEPNE